MAVKKLTQAQLGHDLPIESVKMKAVIAAEIARQAGTSSAPAVPGAHTLPGASQLPSAQEATELNVDLLTNVVIKEVQRYIWNGVAAS